MTGGTVDETRYYRCLSALIESPTAVLDSYMQYTDQMLLKSIFNWQVDILTLWKSCSLKRALPFFLDSSRERIQRPKSRWPFFGAIGSEVLCQLSKHILQFGAEGPVGMNNPVHDRIRILNVGDVEASFVFSYCVSDAYLIKFSPQAGIIKKVEIETKFPMMTQYFKGRYMDVDVELTFRCPYHLKDVIFVIVNGTKNELSLLFLHFTSGKSKHFLLFDLYSKALVDFEIDFNELVLKNELGSYFTLCEILSLDLSFQEKEVMEWFGLVFGKEAKLQVKQENMCCRMSHSFVSETVALCWFKNYRTVYERSEGHKVSCFPSAIFWLTFIGIVLWDIQVSRFALHLLELDVLTLEKT